MTTNEGKPFPRLWFWAGVLAAVAATGNLALWIVGFVLPADTLTGVFAWWMQFFLALLFGASAAYYFWRSKQDRERIAKGDSPRDR